MADIVQDFPIKAPVDRVCRAVTTGDGLATWWTKQSSGMPEVGAEYHLGFGPGYDWRGRVTRYVANAGFELEMVVADSDWIGTRVGIDLEPREQGTWVRFSHRGWPEASEHYRVSCHCWAMYLRILRRSLEAGESVPYEKRLDA